MANDAPLEDQQAIAALADGVAKRMRAKQPYEQVLEYLITATRWPRERAETFIHNIAAQESAPRATYSGGADPEQEATEWSYVVYAVLAIVGVILGVVFGWD
jgi:hypothetical protein